MEESYVDNYQLTKLIEFYGQNRKEEVIKALMIHKKHHDVSTRVLNKYIDNGFENLSDNEKNFWYIEVLLQDVNNGGFDQYFSNTECKELDLLLNALSILGDTKYTKLVCLAAEIYCNQIESDSRYEKLNTLDNEFYKFDLFDYVELYEKCNVFY